MLAIKDLTIKTRKTILEDFSMDFNEGNLYGIVAVNGSGKTTFFRSVMGLIPTLSGSIKISSSNPNRKSNIKASCFYFESSEWFDKNLSGLDYLNFVKKEWKSSVNIKEVIDLWNMSEYVKLPIKKYSLGMKQRLLISLYMVSQAQYLLMDEISNGLDEKSRTILFEQLNKYKAEGKVIILSSHYKEDIDEYCDYLLTIKNKRMEVTVL